MFRFALVALLVAFPAYAQGLSGSGLSSASDPNNASFGYNLTPSHVVSGQAYSVPSRAMNITCTAPTQVVVSLLGNGSGNGGTLNVTLANSPTYQLALSAYMVTEVTSGSLAANCVVDLIR